MLAAVFELGHVLGHQVLVRHDGNGQMPPDHGHDLAGAVAGGIDHHLRHHLAFVGGNQPLAIGLLRQSGDPGMPAYPGAKFTRGPRQRLGQLRRVDVAVQRVPQRTQQVMGLDEGVSLLQIAKRQDVVIQPIRLGHGLYMVELVHAVAGVRQPNRASHVVADRVLCRCGQLPVKRGRILLQLQDAPAGGEGGQVAGRMPGGARGELVPLQQQGVGDAHLSQMVQTTAADNTAADDDDFCILCHFRLHGPVAGKTLRQRCTLRRIPD